MRCRGSTNHGTALEQSAGAPGNRQTGGESDERIGYPRFCSASTDGKHRSEASHYHTDVADTCPTPVLGLVLQFRVPNRTKPTSISNFQLSEGSQECWRNRPFPTPRWRAPNPPKLGLKRHYRSLPRPRGCGGRGWRRLVVAAPHAGLRELADVQLVQQICDPVVDVLGAGASLRDALSAWNPLTSKENSAISASSTGIRKASEIAATVPTCCHWVTSSTTLMWYAPLDPV